MSRHAAVVFDLDGTITTPLLDFERIRAEIGIATGPVLEIIERFDAHRRRVAEEILHRHEKHAAEHATPQPGARETVALLRQRGFPVGVLTRNARRWAQLVLERLDIEVDGLRARDDGVVKPEPDGVLALCEAFAADPARSWMVGDFQFDIEAGRRAGMRTVLLVNGETVPAYAVQADHVIRRLPELSAIIAAAPTTEQRRCT